MAQQFVFDSRLPVSNSLSLSDPNHPKNVSRTLKVTEMQSNADTKYDIIPPPRVEGFQNRHDAWLFFGAVCVVVIGLFILIRPLPLVFKFSCIAVVIFALNYAAGKLENRTV